MTGEVIGKDRKLVKIRVVKYDPAILDDPRLKSAVTSVLADGTSVPEKSPIVTVYPEQISLVGEQTDRHEWVPTAYSKKNHSEWFAELIREHVFGKLAKEPSTWLVSVIRTGKG